MLDLLNGLNAETKVLLSLSIILFSGFILTRMTNTLNMPKVSGYILAGILIGPCCLNLIPPSIINGMSFVSDLALAFIAFGVGKFFKKDVLLRTGKRIIIITISEALAAGALVTILLKFMFHLNWEFTLILGAIATATAPASTMMTINQYKAKGEFVDTLLQIVALDDVVCLLAFSIVTAVINGNATGGFSTDDILFPVVYNIFVIALGAFCGYFLSRLLVLPTRSRDNRLILVIAMLLGLSGICAAIDISPLLSCMVFGAVYINLTKDKKLFRQINSFTPPVMSVFFILSGMNLDVRALRTVGTVGVSYFFIRIAGKYLGTYISCLVTHTSKEIRNFMGLALIPQAGVAIGLAFLGQRMLPPETGNMMLTIILSSSVLYEMVGPVSAKAALLLSGSISYGHKKEKEPEDENTNRSSATGQENGTVLDEGNVVKARMETAEIEGTETEKIITGKTKIRENKTAQKTVDKKTSHKKKSELQEEIKFKGTTQEVEQKQQNRPEEKKTENTSKGEKLRKKDKTDKRKTDQKIEKKVKQKPKKYLLGMTEERFERYEEEGEELHAVLPELREYGEGVREHDVYDIEKDIKTSKK